MLSFFTPQLKIQKNRQVLRETDERMAKYSRRGLMSNFIIFLLCMAVGKFVDMEPGIAIALSIGLLITTMLRGYLLIRFDALYPRAPGLWRTRYFYATLLGAAWWGLIVAIETLTVGIENEGPLLWLYTIVFFSMTANAFAPYKQFLTVYQLLGLVPGTFCLLFTGEMTGVIYAVVVTFFIWLLHHQCEQTADTYWERLESGASLERKTESLEEEKRDTRATAQLHRDYMLLLKKELEELLNTKRSRRTEDNTTPNTAQDNPEQNTIIRTVNARRPRLHQLHANVSDFYQILTKDIDFNASIFNPKALLQYIITQYSHDASQKNIDIELVFSPNLPHLVLGDTQRLGQIIQSMMNAIVIQLDEGALFIDVEYIQERGKAGELSIAANHQPNSQRTLFNAQQATGIQLNLELALAIGLAEAQEGSLDVTSNNQGTQLRYRSAFADKAKETIRESVIPALKGKRILLVHENPRVLDSKRQELGRLGLTVSTETLFKRGLSTLRSAIGNNTPFSAIVFHSHADPKASADFSRALLAENDCKLIPQIIMGSKSARQLEDFSDIIASPYVHWINKPAVIDDFKLCFWELFNQDEQRVSLEQESTAIIATEIPESLIDQLTQEGLSCQAFSSMKLFLSGTEKNNFQHVVFMGSENRDNNDYSKLRESCPIINIVASDSPEQAQQHLEHGADHFVSEQTINTQLATLIKALT